MNYNCDNVNLMFTVIIIMAGAADDKAESTQLIQATGQQPWLSSFQLLSRQRGRGTT